MRSDKNCPDIRALVNVHYHWGSHWTPPGRLVKLSATIIKFLSLEFLGLSHRIPRKIENAIYRLEISALVPEIFKFD